MSTVAVECFAGQAIEPHFSALAALRIEVFREYPYLYQGTREYEARYLSSYAQSARSVIVIARDGDQVVGASTAMPLTEHSENVAPAIARAGFDPERVYYFGESVLRVAYRRHGIGHAFFDHREASARAHGFSIAAFCAVVRPDDHPRKPPDYVAHDAFWTKRGYVKRPDIVATFSWCDVGELEETDKAMVFWLKELRP